jgi:hypothetical protein
MIADAPRNHNQKLRREVGRDSVSTRYVVNSGTNPSLLYLVPELSQT